jgi:hypothetical protein
MHRGSRIINIFSALIMLIIIAWAIYRTVIAIQSMQFQLTHPITRARVLSVYTHTVDGQPGGCSAYDPQTGACSAYDPPTPAHTETCAARISFRANGQDIEVDVSELSACPMSVGDQPKIAYDLQQQTHVQFVFGGDPFWGNLLQILVCAGFFLTVGICLLRPFSKWAWVILFLSITGMIALNVMNGINLKP